MSAAVAAALGQEVAYNHLQYNSGALHGTVEVASAADFDGVLRTAYAALAEVLGDDVDRVVFYRSGRTPDGAAVTAETLGLPTPPSGHDRARRFG